MASNVGEAQGAKPFVGKKLWVSVDNTLEEVVEWNEGGATLLFSHEPGRFLELDPNILSKTNKDRYLVSKMMNEEAVVDKDPVGDIMSRIDFDIQGMKALDKMKVPKSPDWVYGWRDAATLPKAISQGWQVVSNEATVVNPKGKGESHLVGKNQKTEQVMVKIRRDRYQENIRIGSAAVEAFVNGEEDKMRERINRQTAGSDLDADPRTRLTDAIGD